MLHLTYIDDDDFVHKWKISMTMKIAVIWSASTRSHIDNIVLFYLFFFSASLSLSAYFPFDSMWFVT